MLGVTLVAACARTAGEIEVVRPAAGAAASEGRRGDYETALTAIADAFAAAVGLPRPQAALVVFPTRRRFEQGLLEIGYPPALARSASSFDAIGGARAVLVNGATVNGFDRTRRVRLLAHELVHTLQYQFGGGTRGASEQWLREGFAEWVACRITAHLGLESMASLRQDLIGRLANARFGLAPAPFDRLVTFPQWVDAQGRVEAPVYTQAYIAAEMLIEMRGVPAVVRYFERFKTTTDYRTAFAEAFGLERGEFERLFARRWREALAEAAAGRDR